MPPVSAVLGEPPNPGVEGSLRIRLGVRAGRVAEVAIDSSRPFSVTRIFWGKTAAELVTLLPLIYSICGVAQGAAAASALEQAMSNPAPEPLAGARRLLVYFEAVKEHLWRIELDWAGALKRMPRHETVSRAGRLMVSFRQALFGDDNPFMPLDPRFNVPVSDINDLLNQLQALLRERIYGWTPGEWLKLSNEEDLQSWVERTESVASRMLSKVQGEGLSGFGGSEIEALPELEAEILDQRLRSDGVAFISRPDWCGKVGETGPFTRQLAHPVMRSLTAHWGNGLLPRLVARLLELASLLEALKGWEQELVDRHQGAAPVWIPPAGTGLSQLEASRGRLVHRVELDDGRVGRYQILAPTEWNFHPQGVVARGLHGTPAEDEALLLRKAQLLVNAVDPCVSCRLEIDLNAA